MKSLSLAVLLLSAAIAAQSYRSSPPGFLAREGALMPGIGVEINRASVYFGAFPSYEIQILDGHLRGIGARTIKQIDHRADFRYHTQSKARSWQSVTLQASECLHDSAISPAFSRNVIGSQTVVFTGSMSWPELRGTPHRNAPPNVWGAEVRFPFRRPWATPNTRDVMLHYTFQGGRLANNTSWARPVTYALDAAFNDRAGTGFRHYYRTGGTGCVDAAHSATGQVSMFAETHAPVSWIRSRSNLVRIESDVSFVAPSQTVVYAYSLSDQPGITFGPACQHLGVNLGLAVQQTGVADARGNLRRILTAPYTANLVNRRVYKQAAWADSRTNQLKLTWQSFVQIARQPLGKMRVVFRSGSGSATVDADMQRIPLLRYEFQ